ncbi:hypothetical protein BHM03_00032650, partial [Ensete ventricosum]
AGGRGGSSRRRSVTSGSASWCGSTRSTLPRRLLRCTTLLPSSFAGPTPPPTSSTHSCSRPAERPFKGHRRRTCSTRQWSLRASVTVVRNTESRKKNKQIPIVSTTVPIHYYSNITVRSATVDLQ